MHPAPVVPTARRRRVPLPRPRRRTHANMTFRPPAARRRRCAPGRARTSRARTSRPAKRRETSLTPSQHARSPPASRMETPPAPRASGIGAMTRPTVSRPSSQRSNRSHVVNGSRASARTGTSVRSSTSRPNPPDESTSPAALMARSTRRAAGSGRSRVAVAGRPSSAVPRTHSRCDQRMPRSAADAGSKRSPASMNAASSPRAVAAAIALIITRLRPEDGAPTTSDNCPRASPPPSRTSRAASPDGAESGAAGCASGIAEVSVRSSFRARRSDSRAARDMMFRFMFASIPQAGYRSTFSPAHDLPFKVCCPTLNYAVCAYLWIAATVPITRLPIRSKVRLKPDTDGWKPDPDTTARNLTPTPVFSACVSS